MIGARQRRIEDPPLLSGRGRYLDDIELSRQLEMAVLRSPYPHARIVSIDAREALALPGVVDVITGADLVGLVGPQPILWEPIPDQRVTRGLALGVDRALYVGHAVAAVAASDRYVAEDALDLIQVEYEPLPAVMTPDAALADGAPSLCDDWPGNIVAETVYAVGDADAAMASADVVVEGTFTLARQAGCPLETRGCVAIWTPYANELDVWLSTQAPHSASEMLAEVLGLPPQKVRVRVPDVGGAFGNKFDFYGEEVIASVLARRTARPVKFVEDRMESFAATVHARGQRLSFQLGADETGRMVALRGTVTAPLGGEMGTTGVGPGWFASIIVGGPYVIPNVAVTYRGVLTNQSPAGSYRGWGQPQANFTHERLVSRLADRLGLHANEIRRRNLPPADAFPIQSFLLTLDSGNYPACLAACEKAVEDHGWLARREQAQSEGRALGIGYGFHIENSASGSSRVGNMLGLKHALFDEEVVRIDSGGGVTVSTGQAAMGQGIATALAQVAAATLGVAIEDVRVHIGDTATTPYTGYGTGGSRAGAVGGAAVLRAATRLRERVLEIAAGMLAAPVDDLTILNGIISVADAPERRVTFAEIGDACYRRPEGRLPAGVAYTLEERAIVDPPAGSFSYGCTAVMVEVDRETGQTTVLDYLIVHDCGTVINEMIVDGQLHGAIAQGIGEALYEELLYDASGQLVTTTFMDYLLPTSTEIPRMRLEHMCTPSPNVPGGMKGVGEAGVIGAPGAVVSAIEDAVRELGLQLDFVPVTPNRLWSLIQTARKATQEVAR